MGQQVSTDVRSRLEHQTLEELLVDDKYVEELEQLLPGLPKTSQNNLAKIIASWQKAPSKGSNSRSRSNQPSNGSISLVKDTNSRSYKLGSLWSIQSQDFNVPQNAAEVLKRDHRNLLRQSSKNGVNLQSPSDYYEYTCSVETDRILCKILWRFLTTFYYDLISELDATKNLLSKASNGGVAFVVAVICQSGKHDRDIVREKVVGWAKIGRRYRGYMNALCSGCLFLFPEKISDLVWETYVPVKGSTFDKVIQFLRELGIVYKCEEEGWNDLSDQILQSLRGPFRSIIPFQFLPDQQPQLTCASNRHPLASVPGEVEVHKHKTGPLPRQVTNRVIKATRKKGTASVRRQLQNFARDLASRHTSHIEEGSPLVSCQGHRASTAHSPETQHESHGRDLQYQLPQVPKHWHTPISNDPRQWHLEKNHQHCRLPSFQFPPNDPAQKSLNEISLNPTNSHDLNEQQKTGAISDTSRREGTGVNTISALLNHDNKTPATAIPITQDSPRGSNGHPVSDVTAQQGLDDASGIDAQSELCLNSVTQEPEMAPTSATATLLRAIRVKKNILQQVVLERPNDILGGIWFGSLPGFQPFVSLRLSRALDITIKLSGQEVYAPGPPPDASSTVTGIHLIKLGVFRQMIRRDGFGEIFWNECGDEAFVRMDVVDERLAADFIRGAVPD